jgi:hypothetical protein
MALKVGSCFSLQGLFSILLLLSTFSSHYRAETYSNYINNDDDYEDSTATIASIDKYNAILYSTSPSYVYDATTHYSNSSINFASTLSSAPFKEDKIDSRVIAKASTKTTISTTTTASLITTESTTLTTSSSEANEISYQFNFTHAIYNVTIPENSVQKTYVVQPYSDKDRMGIQLYGNDGTHHIDVKYQIIGGDKNKIFKAEERIVGDFAFLTIRTRTNNIVLNREKGDSYRLRIKATLTRSHSRLGTKRRTIQEAETFVDVKVLDKNDLSPLFYPTKYSITITDDTPLHQSILRVTAEDADVGINGGNINKIK